MVKVSLFIAVTFVLTLIPVFAKETYMGRVTVNPGESFTWTIEKGKDFELNENIMTPYGINLTSLSCNSHCNLTFETNSSLQQGTYAITVLAHHKTQIQNELIAKPSSI
jgi:hypothetical protein